MRNHRREIAIDRGRGTFPLKRGVQFLRSEHDLFFQIVAPLAQIAFGTILFRGVRQEHDRADHSSPLTHRKTAKIEIDRASIGLVGKWQISQYS